MSAALPPGTVALYSDGSVERLIETDAKQSLWEDDRKRRYLRASNPIVPVVMRSTFLSGKQSHQQVVAGNPDAIARQAPGAWLEFTVERSKSTGERSRRTWRCKRGGTRVEQVVGMNREIEDYVCERFVLHRKFWQPVIKERREFGYSRELGLVTDMTRTRPRVGKTQQWRLSQLITPRDATYQNLSKQVRELRAARTRR